MTPRDVVRINIYVPDAAVRRQVKTAAAQRDLSISDYCLQAITAQLARDRVSAAGDHPASVALPAVDRARRFQAQTFKGRQFRVSSARLIRETRAGRRAGG